MAPRHGQGLDFTPIVTHYLFLATFVLAAVRWVFNHFNIPAYSSVFRLVG